MVLTSTNDLKNDIKCINNKFIDFNQRVTRLEESDKNSQKRLDVLEKRGE